jgi:hypothetical protein
VLFTLWPVAVEKVRFPEIRLKMGDQKCICGRRKSFIGHPSASIFRRDLWERVFQHPRLLSPTMSGSTLGNEVAFSSLPENAAHGFWSYCWLQLAQVYTPFTWNPETVP